VEVVVPHYKAGPISTHNPSTNAFQAILVGFVLSLPPRYP